MANTQAKALADHRHTMVTFRKYGKIKELRQQKVIDPSSSGTYFYT